MCCVGLLCRSMSKLKNKKTAQANKMTAAWVDSMPITISDDDNDDDNELAAPSSDTLSAAVTAGQSSTVTSDSVLQTSDAAKPSYTDELSAGGRLPAVKHLDAMDTTPASTDATSSSAAMLADGSADIISPAVLPEELHHVDCHTAMSTDAVMMTAAVSVAAAESVNIGTESLADGTSVTDAGTQSSAVQNSGKTESSTVEGDDDSMLSCCFFV